MVEPAASTWIRSPAVTSEERSASRRSHQQRVVVPVVGLELLFVGDWRAGEVGTLFIERPGSQHAIAGRNPRDSFLRGDQRIVGLAGCRLVEQIALIL